MIVERGHVGLIISGRRTRSVVRVDQTTPGYRDRKPRIGGVGQSRQLVRPRNPLVANRITVRQRDLVDGRERATEVVVTARRQALAGDVNDQDATAMGYRTLTAWQAWWVREQAPTWIAREEARQLARWAASTVDMNIDERLVHSLAAEHAGDVAAAMLCCYSADLARALLDEGAVQRADDDTPVSQTLTVAQLAERFGGYHANDAVWIVDHEPAVENRPELLADRPGSTLDDYVHSPAAAMSGGRDPGEAVDRSTTKRLGQQAVLRRQQGVAADWLALRQVLEQQIRVLEAAHDLDPKQLKHLQRLRFQLDGGDKRFAA